MKVITRYSEGKNALINKHTRITRQSIDTRIGHKIGYSLHSDYKTQIEHNYERVESPGIQILEQLLEVLSYPFISNWNPVKPGAGEYALMFFESSTYKPVQIGDTQLMIYPLTMGK